MTDTQATPASERQVTLVHGQERRLGTLRWGRVPDTRRYRVALDGPDGHVEAEERDLFEALTTIRRGLEPRGWFIAVQGSRGDAYPSGMLRDTIGARRVYVFKQGTEVEKGDMVDIFDDADPTAVTTVDQQRLNYRQWRQSLRRG